MQVADLSVDLVWAAATVLTIALVFFAIDLARLSAAGKSGRRAPAEAAKAAARDVEAAAHEDAAATVTRQTDARAQATPVAVAGRASAGVRSRSSAGGTGGGVLVDEAVDADEPATVPVVRRFANIGVSLSWLGALLLLGGIVARGIAAGRAPWANMYEFTLVGTLVAVTVFLVVNLRRDVRFLGSFVTGLAVLFLVLAQNEFYIAATGVQPALQRYWLVIHVGVAIAASGIFTVSFLTSVLQLARDSRENGNPYLGRPGLRWLDELPNATQLEALSFRLNAVGFVLWTFTVIGGAIWAEDAWGRYWGWDPKEVWSFVVWVVYAAYLHARTTRGWSGRRAAYLVLVGYACVLFNFTGVNLIFHGKHSYSGLTG